MARKTSTAAWLLGLGLLLCAVAVVVLLLGEDDPLLPGRPPDELAGGSAEAARRMQLPEAPERAAEPVAGLPVPAPEVAGEVEGGRTVAGRLLRAADGSPLRGWTLRSRSATTETGSEDGRFELAGVDADERRLELLYRERVLEVPLPDARGDLLDLELVVDTGWLVPGLVLSAAGAPVADATVRAEGDVPPVAADASGRFLLADVISADAGPVASLSADAPWHVRGVLPVRLEGSGRRTAPVEFRLQASGAIAGRVLAPDGAPAAGHEVRVRLRHVRSGRAIPGNAALSDTDIDAAPESLVATSDAEGAYHIESVPEGSWLLVVSGRRGPGEVEHDDDHAPPALWVPHVAVFAGMKTALHLQLEQGAVVAGRVTDGSGNPVPGATVSATRVLRWSVPPPDGSVAGYFDELRVLIDDTRGGQVALSGVAGTTTTGDDGHYVLGALPGGEVTLTAQAQDAPGWRPLERTLELVPGRRVEGVDFVLGGGLSVSGRVFDEAGRPVAGAAVALLAAEGAAVIAGEDSIATDADGRFAFTGLAAGSSRLYVRHAGHKAQWLAVEAGAPELRIDLVAAPVLAGQVLDAHTRQPVTRYRIRLDTEAMGMSNDWSAEDGRFTIDSLEVEAHTLRIEAPGYAPFELQGVVPGFEGVALEVLLQPGG